MSGLAFRSLIHFEFTFLCGSSGQSINLQNIQIAHATYYQKNKKIQVKNEWKNKIDISPKKTYKWSRCIRKDAQHH